MPNTKKPAPALAPDGTVYLGLCDGKQVLAKPAPEKNASTCGKAHHRGGEQASFGHADWHLPDTCEASLLSAAFREGRLPASKKAADREYWTSETAWPYRPLATSFNLRSGALAQQTLATETLKSGHTVARGGVKLSVWLVRKEPIPLVYKISH